MAKLLARHETLSSSLEIVFQYLEKARQTLRALPGSHGARGCLGSQNSWRAKPLR